MADDKPPPFVNRIFNACLLILGAMIALSLAINVLRCIWPWLLGAALLAGVVWAVWHWHRRDSGW